MASFSDPLTAPFHPTTTETTTTETTTETINPSSRSFKGRAVRLRADQFEALAKEEQEKKAEELTTIRSSAEWKKSRGSMMIGRGAGVKEDDEDVSNGMDNNHGSSSDPRASALARRDRRISASYPTFSSMTTSTTSSSPSPSSSSPSSSLPPLTSQASYQSFFSPSSSSSSSSSAGPVSLKKSESVVIVNRNQRGDAEYESYLQRARKEPLEDIAALNFIYRAGTDDFARPIIVIIGAHIPARKIDLERIMLYIIKVMDPVVEGDYVLVYVHTNISSDNKPTFAWMRKFYAIFNRKYKKNLKLLYIVHPTLWVKMTFRLFRPFLSSKFWKKLVYIEGGADVYSYFPKDQITLPSFVVNYGVTRKKVLPTFGEPLEEVVNRPENNGLPIPLIMDVTIKYLAEKALSVEGIFRLSGGSREIKELKRCWDAGEELDVNDVEDPHVIAGLLKLYLRELPIPLFPDLCYSAVVEANRISNEQERIQHLRGIIQELPKAHLDSIKYLFLFLHQVSKFSKSNKMTPSNLSIVMGPNVLRDSKGTMQTVIQDAPAINLITAFMVTHAGEIMV